MASSLNPEKFFPPEACLAVQQAVEEVERESSAEVVPVVVQAAGEYPQAAWRAALLGALGAPLGLALLHQFVELWGIRWELLLLVPPFVGGGLGFLSARLFPPVARLFLLLEEMETQARERAEHAFLTEEVFATRERSGMLLFVSLFEHQVVVLGDRGIASRIPQERWAAVAQGVARGIREGKASEALIGGIRECGKLLKEAGLLLQPGDTNELRNDLRL